MARQSLLLRNCIANSSLQVFLDNKFLAANKEYATILMWFKLWYFSSSLFLFLLFSFSNLVCIKECLTWQEFCNLDFACMEETNVQVYKKNVAMVLGQFLSYRFFMFCCNPNLKTMSMHVFNVLCRIKFCYVLYKYYITLETYFMG